MMVTEISCQYELAWLPREIWVNIFETYQLHGIQTDDTERHRDRSRLDTLLSISSTCRGFYHLVRPILYRTLDFRIHGNHAGLTLLIETLVEDPDVWQYVQQIRLPGFGYLVDSPVLNLGTGSANEERSKLLTHLETLGISPDLIREMVESNQDIMLRNGVVAAVLLCLCRNVRTLDPVFFWRTRGQPNLSPLSSKTLSERNRVPTLAHLQAHPKLSLDRRPCAEIKSIKIFGGKNIEIGELVPFLELPSVLTLEMSNIYSVSRPDPAYKHLAPVPSWNLRSLRIERCTLSACLVVDVVRACKQLRHLDIDARHTPGRPAFRYDHLGEHLMHYNRKLEVLICRTYKVSNTVAFLERNRHSLGPLTSLRVLALPLGTLWNLHRETEYSFEDVLPVSLQELHIFSAAPGLDIRGEDFHVALFLDLIRSQQYPDLACIRIGEHTAYAKTISLIVDGNSLGWKAGWDAETREHVYTRSIRSASQDFIEATN